MVLNIRAMIVMVTLIAAIALMAGSAFAAKPVGNARAGWGFGDNNHVHTGPPGGPSQHPVK